MGDDPEALAAEAELAVRHRATSKSVIACLTALGPRLGADMAALRRPSHADRLPSMGDRRQEVRWPAVSNARKQLGPGTAADVIAFIEQVCFVPEGKFVDYPLKLQDWQKDILRLIWRQRKSDPTRRAIVNMGREERENNAGSMSATSPNICAARRPATSPIRIAFGRSVARSSGDHF